jgi:hypothetical protein
MILVLTYLVIFSIISECGADFETAISETGFGIFNFLLLLVTIPSILTTQFETSALSYVFPAAQCDLNLSLEDKGSVNAITYTGTYFLKSRKILEKKLSFRIFIHSYKYYFALKY